MAGSIEIMEVMLDQGQETLEVVNCMMWLDHERDRPQTTLPARFIQLQQ